MRTPLLCKKAKIMATHENFNEFQRVKLGSNKNFCLTFSSVFLIIGLYPFLRQDPLRLWPLIASGIFLILAFTKPQIIAPLNRIWAMIGLALGKIVTPVVMGCLYFSVFLFTGIILRILNKTPLNINFDSSLKTYWRKREDIFFHKETFEKQF